MEELENKIWFKCLKILTLLTACVMFLFTAVLTAMGFKLIGFYPFVGYVCFGYAVICAAIGHYGKKKAGY